MQRDLSHPLPLSTPECDLRGMEWMPLQTQDLLDSDLYLFSTGEEFKAAVTLICRSWRQVPAGSLPADDNALATLSGARDWTMVKTMALRNWVLCSDGRLYHPIVARKAMEALPHREEFVAKKSAAAERKDRERKARKDLFEVLRKAEIVPPFDAKTSELRRLVDTVKSRGKDALVTQESHAQSHDLSRLGQGPDTTPPDLSLSPIGQTASDSPPPAGDGDPPAEPVQDDGIPPCPHLDILRLWKELLPQLPQHDPEQWHKTRRSNLQTRWRETAATEARAGRAWATQRDGLRYFAKLFRHIATSKFLTGRAPQRDKDRTPFVIELEWLVLPTNWAKVLEGKYHTED